MRHIPWNENPNRPRRTYIYTYSCSRPWVNFGVSRTHTGMPRDRTRDGGTRKHESTSTHESVCLGCLGIQCAYRRATVMTMMRKGAKACPSNILTPLIPRRTHSMYKKLSGTIQRRGADTERAKKHKSVNRERTRNRYTIKPQRASNQP